MTQAPTPRTPPARTPPPSGPSKPSGPPSPASPTSNKTFTTSSGPKKKGRRVVIYGVHGSGKTALASLAPKPKFIDLDSDGSAELDVQRVEGVKTHEDVLAALRTPALWSGVETVVLDSATVLEELAEKWVIANVPHEKGKPIRSIKDYGYGQGDKFIFEQFMLVLAALDQHVEQGRNAILICHHTVGKTPNPEGEDFTTHQPALLRTDKVDIRGRVGAWCNDMLFINYDKMVAGGKAEGSGTRTILVQERPAYWAKSRKLRNDILYADPLTDPVGAAEVWRQLGIVQ